MKICYFELLTIFLTFQQHNICMERESYWNERKITLPGHLDAYHSGSIIVNYLIILIPYKWLLIKIYWTPFMIPGITIYIYTFVYIMTTVISSFIANKLIVFSVYSPMKRHILLIYRVVNTNTHQGTSATNRVDMLYVNLLTVTL